jgi:hypothetical protein
MSKYSYEGIDSFSIDNLIIEKMIKDNEEIVAYQISPKNGFLFHDKRTDGEDENGNIIFHLKNNSSTVPLNYDFDNIIEDTYTYINENNEKISIPILKVGEYEFYAIPIEIIPEERNV